MRLLYFDDNGQVSLTKDLLGSDKIPRYAILSHTWGDEEVTFEDLTDGTGEGKKGYEKIRFCMQQAAADGLQYSWVDTCCINKNDFTELQHAINSFFRWYRGAETCYVFLSDVSATKRKVDSDFYLSNWESAFRSSRWFTRGWTLQELLAPRRLRFFSREKKLLGDNQDLLGLVQDITSLPTAALSGDPLDGFEIEERLRWTQTRTTTREEDKAYSLLGIFGIFMPLIYGEGEENAFRRLRREIHDRKYLSLESVTFSNEDFECLRSLSFHEQESRYNDIHVAIDTCEWLSKDPDYNTWTKSPRGLFWIKGHPGTGKPVLMKHAYRSMAAQYPSELITSFFIHGRGSELQRTPLGVFRALLNTLLGHFPVALARLTKKFEDREKRFGGYQANRWSWNEKELQESLSEVLLKHTEDRSVTVFVDALDESGEDPARTLLAYFADLSDRAKKCQARVKLCVSSRHYPIIGLDQFPTTSVEEKNSLDIQWYVKERFGRIASSTKHEQVQTEIMLRAQGGFQWVFLVTQILIDRSLTGRSLAGHIATCPRTLSEMYATLLDTGYTTDKSQMIKLFQWILFAKRPVSAQELREALATDVRMACTSVSKLRSHDDWSETLTDFERYVQHISKGLVEFRSRGVWEQWEDSDREAQFIHQSVADFLIENYAIDREEDATRAGHFQISRSCLGYLSMTEIQNERQLTRDEMSSKFPLLPYAVRYVFEHIEDVERAGRDQSDLLSVTKLASNSDTVPNLAELWRILNPQHVGTPVGWPFPEASELHIMAALGSASALRASLDDRQSLTRKDHLGNTPLHTAIVTCHEDAAIVLLDRLAGWRQRDPDLTAISGRLGALDIKNHDGETALDVAVTMRANAIAIRLMDLGADLQSKEQQRLLVRHTVNAENTSLLALLIAKRFDLAGAVYFAIENRSSGTILSQLLEAGGDLDRLETSEGGDDHYDPDADDGGNALHLACRMISAEHVDLLLTNGVSVASLNRHSECPLHVAIKEANTESDDLEQICESFLRQYPAVVELARHDGATPLDLAGESVLNSLVVRMLAMGQFSDSSGALTHFLFNEMESGDFWHGMNCDLSSIAEKIDLSLKDDQGRSVLWLSVAYGRIPLLMALLQKDDTDVNVKDSSLNSPLLGAIKAKTESAVNLLLRRKDIDVNTQDDKGNSPLLIAVRQNMIDTVQSLLRFPSINLAIRNCDDITPLHEAVNCDSIALVELLRSAIPAGTRFRDLVGSPLSQVVSDRDPAIFDLIYDAEDADVETIETAQSELYSAVLANDAFLVKLLVNTQQLDVNKTYNDFGLLELAMLGGHAALVEMLLGVNDIDINIQPKHKPFPSILWWAALEHQKTMLPSLLDVDDADLDVRDDAGQTLLLWAAMRGHESIVMLLLDTGRVDINCKDCSGQTAIARAEEHGHWVIVQLLKAYIPQTQPSEDPVAHLDRPLTHR